MNTHRELQGGSTVVEDRHVQTLKRPRCGRTYLTGLNWHTTLLLSSLFVLLFAIVPTSAMVQAQGSLYDTACAQLFDGEMVGYWGFDEPLAPTRPIYGPDVGVLVGQVGTAPGKVGQALELSGNGYVNFGTELDVPAWDSYTVSVWFLNDGRLPAVRGYEQKIFDKTTYFSDFFVGVSNDPGQTTPRAVVFTYDRNFKNMQTSGYDYIDGQWHHALITKDGTHGELWVDGVLIDAKDDVEPTINNQPLLLGYSLSPDGFQRIYWGGYLDEFAIFNRALTAAEIGDLYTKSLNGNHYCAFDGYVVNSTNDPGDGVCDATECTLREAITQSNNEPRFQSIFFNIPGEGPHTIQLDQALPKITQGVTIDGYTQPGAKPNTLPLDQGSNAQLKIELNGGYTGTYFDGFYDWNLLIDAYSVTIRGLVLNGFNRDAIFLQYGGENHIEGNYIGLNLAGDACVPNRSAGILIGYGSRYNVIGGTDPAARNVIGCNREHGIRTYGDNSVPRSNNNHIVGNYIGTDAQGLTPLGNGRNGISIEYAGRSYGTMGALIEQNVISGNNYHGISMWRTSDVTIRDNRIGTNRFGTAAIENKRAGIWLSENVTDNVIGDATHGNIIAYNREAGVVVYGWGQPYPVRNRIFGNSIFSNSIFGIDLYGADSSGFTYNDPGDVDVGPNELQNFPELTLSGGGRGLTMLQGTFNTTPNRTYTIDFYSNPQCLPYYPGQGKRYLGATTAQSDAQGNVAFVALLPADSGMNELLTATATTDDGSTSEFSRCLRNRGLISGDLAQVGMVTDGSRLHENIFIVHATFRNQGTLALRDGLFGVSKLAYRTGELTPPDLIVLNAEGGPYGTGAMVAMPPLVEPGATFDVTFELKLPRIEPFDFYVNGYGFLGPAANADFTPAIEPDPIDGPDVAPFTLSIAEAELVEPEPEETVIVEQIYLPLIAR